MPNRRENIVAEMRYVFCKAGDTLFNQGDIAAYFFLIDEGTVEVIIEDEIKRILSKGGYFGDLALLYNAPRTATIRCKTDTYMWALHRKHFQDCIKRIKLDQFRENKKIVENVKFFDHLTTSQKAAIALEMIKEKFEAGHEIVSEGDDALSFYVIKTGKVSIVKSGSKVALLEPGSYFGESSLSKGNTIKRSATVRCESEVECLSIGKSAFLSIFGDVHRLVDRNILRYLIRESPLLKGLTIFQVERFVNQCKKFKFKYGETIIERGSVPKEILFIVGQSKFDDDFDEESFTMRFFGDLYIENSNPPPYQRGVISSSDNCAVFRLTYEHIIKSLEGESLATVFERNEHTKELFKRVNTCEKIENLDQFRYLKTLGLGGYGVVLKVVDQDDIQYALKVIAKDSITSRSAIKLMKHEKEVLEMVEFPFLIKLHATCKDKKNFYLIMDYVKGEGFDRVLYELDILDTFQVQFYIGCIILMLQYLHERFIMYRDLKPDNILVDEMGYLKLVDFGTSKCLSSFVNTEGVEENTEDSIERTFTMVGTPHYMAPEVLMQTGYNYSADYWSLGVVLYEMVCGFVPFGYDDSDVYKIYEAIQEGSFSFPEDLDDKNCKNLISKLLDKSPHKRVDGTIATLMAHPFFHGLSWQSLVYKEIEAPFIPKDCLSVSSGSSCQESKLEDKIKEEMINFWENRERQITRKNDLELEELDQYF